MQQIFTSQDITLIKWAFGSIAFFVIIFNAIIGYFLREIHQMIKEDHKVLQSICTEHKVFHKEETGMID